MLDSAAQRHAVTTTDSLPDMSALLVSPGDAGWMVDGNVLARPKRFPTKEQAIGFARHWARDNRPCVVRLEIRRGEVAGEWEYEPLPLA